VDFFTSTSIIIAVNKSGKTNAQNKTKGCLQRMFSNVKSPARFTFAMSEGIENEKGCLII